MVILSKKRIAFVCVAICISIVTYIGLSMNSNIFIRANSVPVTGKTIIIDAGHGNPDGGSIGVNGTIESEVNLKIAMKIKELIEESGNTCIMTRIDENGISGLDNATIRQKHVQDLKNRVKIGNESNSDIFVSIHLNKIPQTQYSGWQAFYKKDNMESKKLAEGIQKAIKDSVRQRKQKRSSKDIRDIHS